MNVTTQFTRGTSTALLGPNGAGKSTLVQMLCLLMRATEGSILFDGHAADPSESEYRSRIGYLGHKTMLYRSLTARENLQFFAQIYGLNISEAALGDALRLVGLEYEADRAVSEYSRGMAQRLSIARVILHQPSLLLLDEPFTGLDQSGVRMAQDIFRREAERGAITIVVSHDLEATETIVDRCLVLRDGRSVYDGPVKESLTQVYQRSLSGAEP